MVLPDKLNKVQELRDTLTELLALTVQHPDGLRLQKRYRKIQENLFVFLEDERVPATNNSSEQAIRMSTVFRKVTNGFRSEWGKNVYASLRSVINTAQRQGITAYQAICDTLALAPT